MPRFTSPIKSLRIDLESGASVQFTDGVAEVDPEVADELVDALAFDEALAGLDVSDPDETDADIAAAAELERSRVEAERQAAAERESQAEDVRLANERARAEEARLVAEQAAARAADERLEEARAAAAGQHKDDITPANELADAEAKSTFPGPVPAEAVKPLARLNLDELKATATELGVEIPQGVTKAQLRTLIEAKQAS